MNGTGTCMMDEMAFSMYWRCCIGVHASLSLRESALQATRWKLHEPGIMSELDIGKEQSSLYAMKGKAGCISGPVRS
jgi:hypothetical protein